MKLDWLQIHQVRNLSNIKIYPAPRINLFSGPNASGKTAIIEAIYLLSRTRSFRTPRVSELVQHGQATMRVSAGLRHGESGEIRTGIEKGRGSTQILYNGEAVRKLSDQAKNVPLLLAAPDIEGPVTGDPRLRRHWLDWAMFHVEPTYLEAWKAYHRALRQRNNLLKKQRLDNDSMHGWEIAMDARAVQLNQQRIDFLHQLSIEMEGFAEQLLGFVPGIRLNPGWDTDQTLASRLQFNRQHDWQIGYTRYGLHRADVEFLCNNMPLGAVCSRGQVKLFLILLYIAQAAVTEAVTGIRPIYLLDDYTAEVDARNREKIVQLLLDKGLQSFITTAEEGVKLPRHQGSKMFHVERGEVVKVIE